MTRFEQFAQNIMDGKPVEYVSRLWEPQLAKAVDVMKKLNRMAYGRSCRGVKFTDIKEYYGLNSRSARAALIEYIERVKPHMKDEWS